VPGAFPADARLLPQSVIARPSRRCVIHDAPLEISRAPRAGEDHRALWLSPCCEVSACRTAARPATVGAHSSKPGVRRLSDGGRLALPRRWRRRPADLVHDRHACRSHRSRTFQPNGGWLARPTHGLVVRGSPRPFPPGAAATARRGAPLLSRMPTLARTGILRRTLEP
jgi:hypothetical protein